jgi:hypothetical protein
MWPLGAESLVSLIWVMGLLASLVVVVVQVLLSGTAGLFGLGVAWGIAIAVVATVQLGVALGLDYAYDPRGLRVFLLGPLYTIAFWLVGAAAALHSQIAALIGGPRGQRVVWDIPREGLEPTSGGATNTSSRPD